MKLYVESRNLKGRIVTESEVEKAKIIPKRKCY